VVACDGSAVGPISVIDVATQSQISTLSLGASRDCNSVQVCDDGSTVLATSTVSGRVHRLTIDGAGMLTNTGSSFTSTADPQNVSCAPGSASGVVSERFSGGRIQSFLIPGMAGVDSRTLPAGLRIAGVINPAGDKVFSRGRSGRVNRFGYNSTTGVLSAVPEATISVSSANIPFGIDQIGMHPNGKKLYVPERFPLGGPPAALNVYDPVTLNLLTSIIDPDIVLPTGVCFAANQAPVCSSAWADPGKTWPPNHKIVSVAITGVTDPDGDALTITVDGVSQDEEVDAKGNGDGNTAPDASLSPLQVRAEHQGKGDGRVYTIDFTADDGKGASCQGTVTLCVPHDQGKGSKCVDGGPLFDSTTPPVQGRKPQKRGRK